MTTTPLSMDDLVRSRLYPQLEYFFQKLVSEGAEIRLDGVAALQSRDAFLPGKVAIGLAYLLLSIPPTDARLSAYLQSYRAIAELTVGQDNHSWGIYYYLLALGKLQQAGLLERAIGPETLAALKAKLDWRSFVREQDLSLINLPTNYYGVAFSVARLRMQLGWEDGSVAEALLAKTLEHYDRYSGEFGFSDETEGEGRFDRYSVLLIAEICQRFVQTGLAVPARLKALLRRAAEVALAIAGEGGQGFSFGRSIGPYGDTAAMEILSIAAYLDVLSAEEKRYAYSFSTRCLGRYLEFWFDPALHSVDMWGQGRRTDAYRAKHRILGENFSLIHQFIVGNGLWNGAGFQGRAPEADLGEWLKRTQPRRSLVWFARGAEYERALLIHRTGRDVWSLPLVNGGRSQHDNSPYYPVPFAEELIGGVADSGAAHPQLVPKLLLADGSELLASSFITGIKTGEDGETCWLSYEQPALNRLGGAAPVEDRRVSLRTRYEFAPGCVSRHDELVPAAPLEIERLSLEFLSFSAQATQDGQTVDFTEGRVRRFEAHGLAHCTVAPAEPGHASPSGPMRTRVRWTRDGFTLDGPLRIGWAIHYV